MLHKYSKSSISSNKGVQMQVRTRNLSLPVCCSISSAMKLRSLDVSFRCKVCGCVELQAQLKSGREELVRKACPALTDELVAAMKRAPMRGYDPSILKEPHIYRSGLLSAFYHVSGSVCT